MFQCKTCGTQHKRKKDVTACRNAKIRPERKAKAIQKAQKVAQNRVAIIQPATFNLRSRTIQKREIQYTRHLSTEEPPQPEIVQLFLKCRQVQRTIDIYGRMKAKADSQLHYLLQYQRKRKVRGQFLRRKVSILRGRLHPYEGQNWVDMPSVLQDQEIIDPEQFESQLAAARTTCREWEWKCRKQWQLFGSLSERLRYLIVNIPDLFRMFNIHQIVRSSGRSLQFSELGEVVAQSRENTQRVMASLYQNFNVWLAHRQSLFNFDTMLVRFAERRYTRALQQRERAQHKVASKPPPNKLARFRLYAQSPQLIQKAYDIFLEPLKRFRGEEVPTEFMRWAINIIYHITQKILSNYIHKYQIGPSSIPQSFPSQDHFRTFNRMFYHLLSKVPRQPLMLRHQVGSQPTAPQKTPQKTAQIYRQFYISQKTYFTDTQQLILLIGGLYMETTGDIRDLSLGEAYSRFPLDKPVIIYHVGSFTIYPTVDYYYLGFTTPTFTTNAFHLRRGLLDPTTKDIVPQGSYMYYLEPK